jgi:hypothetical protein
MNKTVLILNSHSLSNFQRCEDLYKFRDLIHIVPVIQNNKMERGSIVHKYIQLHYQNKIRPKASIEKLLNNAFFWRDYIAKRLKVDPKEAYLVYSACMQYREVYKTETWIPLAVEKGFSFKLYEDGDYLFLYEGRPDLVALNSYEDHSLIVSDPKTESARRSLYEFNNQAMGYCYCLNASKFVYNYITFTKEIQFRREPFEFTKEQLAKWYSNTIEWYMRIEDALRKRKFVPSWQCSTQYGVCDYHKICEQTSDVVKLSTIKALFKVKEHRSW